MGYTLIISEKREAAERIAQALDDDETPSRFEEQGVPYFEAYHTGHRLLIVPAIGHLYTIAPEMKEGFRYPVTKVKWRSAFFFNKKLAYVKKWIAAFSRLSKEASEFISGTDNDIEGEVIGYTILKYACGDREGQAKRMVFSTLTRDELRRSYSNLHPTINFPLIEAGETRHIVDFLWGINLSRALTLAVKNFTKRYVNLSTGRVQAPTLKFLVDNEKKIQNFVPDPYWKIHAKVELRSRSYDVEYLEPRIDTESVAKNVVASCLHQRGVINSISVKNVKQNPPVPFDLGTLQRESYRLFGYAPSLTLRLAERLYLEALISYPRTSSQKIPNTINCREVLTSLNRAREYSELISELLAKPNLNPNEGSKEDPAHPAIYPTGNLPETRLDLPRRRIFDLVVRRFMATFGSPAVIKNTEIIIKVNGETFRLHGMNVICKGWLPFYNPYERRRDVLLPSFNVGDEVLFGAVYCSKEYSSPPSRYNPSSLLRLMEDQNIGTKATRSEIIDTLYDRGYIREERIVVTELGFKVIETLEKFCKDVVSVAFTKALEEKMDNIAGGCARKNEVLKDSVNKLLDILNEFKMNEAIIGRELSEAVRKAQMEKLKVGPCPICKTGDLVVLFSRKTGKRFVGCTNYSVGLCNASFPLPQKPYKIKLLRKTCTTCSWPVIAVSRGRRFWNLCLNTNCRAKKKSNTHFVREGATTRKQGIVQ